MPAHSPEVEVRRPGQPPSSWEATQARPIANVGDAPTPSQPPAADEKAQGAYLNRIKHELRADGERVRDEERVEPIANVPCGRSEVAVEVVSSEKHGTALRLTCWAPTPARPGAVRLSQRAYLYIEELEPLVQALGKAKTRLQAAPRAKRAERGQP